MTVLGDSSVLAGRYLAHLRTNGSPERALSLTTSAVFAVLEATVAAGTREIALVTAQDAIADPGERFAVRRLR